MSKQILYTRTIGDTQFQLYRTKMLFPATYNDYKGTIIEQDVLIDVYGLVAATFINMEQIHYDSGPLAPKSYLVSYLLSYMVRNEIIDINRIRETIWKEYETWTWNAYGNPFGKIADQILRRKLKRLLH